MLDRKIGMAVAALCTLVLASRSPLTSEAPSKSMSFRTAGTIDRPFADDMAELLSKVKLLESQNHELKAADLSKDLASQLAALKRENEQLKASSADATDDSSDNEDDDTDESVEDTLLSKVTMLESQNKQLETKNMQLVSDMNNANDAAERATKDAAEATKALKAAQKQQQQIVASAPAAAPLECWDKETFGNRNHTEKHPIPEDRKVSFTGRNSRSCRAARTNFGDEKKYLPMLRKLVRGECVTVVTLGGSVSYGARVGGRKYSYTAKLVESLDTHLPCTTSDGKPGNHTYFNLAMGGTHAAFHATRMQSTPSVYDTPFANADLVIVEFAINDADGTSLPQPKDVEPAHVVQYWNEMLIKMINIKAPEAVIMYLEASTLHWQIGPMHSHPPPYRTDTVEHMQVVQYYDLVQLDIMRMLGPIGTMEKQGFLEHVFFMDAFHAGHMGHSLIASVLSFTLREMIANINEIESNFKVHEPNLERDRKYMYLEQSWEPLLASFSIDFHEISDVQAFTNVKGNGKVHNGWVYDTDVPQKRKSKTLMSSEQDTCVEVEGLDVKEPVTQFQAVVMKSYENFGLMSIYMFCGTTKIAGGEVDCTWKSPSTQMQAVSFELHKPLVGCLELRFKVCHLKRDTPSKVKLFGISTFKANE